MLNNMWGTIATGILTLLVGGVLWHQINGVASSLEGFRQEVAQYRTGDAARIDALTDRVDGYNKRLDGIINVANNAQSAASKNTTLLEDILERSKEIRNEQYQFEKSVAETKRDIWVLFHLVSGGKSFLPVANIISGSGYQNKAVDSYYVQGEIVGDKLNVYPNNKKVLQMLKHNGWRPVNPDNPNSGLTLQGGLDAGYSQPNWTPRAE